MAAVRLRLGVACALLCACVLCRYSFKTSCVAVPVSAVLAADGYGVRVSSGEKRRDDREVSLESASSEALASALEESKTASVAVDGSSDEKSSPEVNMSAVGSQTASVETKKSASVAETSVEREVPALSDRPSSRTATVDTQASSGNVLFLLSDLYERFSDCCVRVRYKLDGKTQVSSGFFVSDEGHVLTPAVGGEDFYVETCSHRQFSAKKCGEDPVSSLCLLQAEEAFRTGKDDKSNERNVSYFSLLRNDKWPKIGQPIVGLSCRLGGAVSPQIGYVTAFQERYFATEFPFVFVRSSLRIDAGDCGGAVLDVRGNLLGMLFHALPDTHETFYMPSQALERVFQDLLLFGNVRYGYAGLSVQSMYDPKTHAVRLQVRTVQPNSPAAQSGFKVNDVLLRVNDDEISSIVAFKNFIFLSKPGDVLQCTVMRGKKTLSLTLILAEKP